MEMTCIFCGEKIKISERVVKSDECPRCGRDLRCCRQCAFYDPGAYNECREVSAEQVVDNERANSCEYFTPRGLQATAERPGENAKRALEALFKK
ncbi:MAG TPA: hypothetical protein ENN79_15875 [Desulfobacteraceae bacterium]|nr:hypothetical protein [Desulfobacteraceae bacterium]